MASEADPPESTPIPRPDVDDDERPSRWSHGPVEEFHIKDSTTGFIPHHIKFSGSAEAKQLKTHLPAGQESNIFKGNEGTSGGECFSKAPIIKKVAYEDTDRLSEDCLDAALSNQAETGTTDNRNQQHKYNFEAAEEMKEEAIEQLKHETREKSLIDVEVSNEVGITPDQHVSGGITKQDTEEAASSMQKNEVESTETDKDDDGGPHKEVLDSLEDQRKDAPVSAPADVMKSSTKDVGSALNASNQKEQNTVGTHLTALQVQYGGTTFNGKSEASFTSAAEEGPEAKPIEGDKLVSEKDKGEEISYHGQRDVSISTMSTSHTLNGEEIIIETDVIGNKRNTSSTPTEVAADKTSSEKIKEVVKEEQPPCPSFAEEYQDKFQTGGKVTDEIPNVEENNLKNAAGAQAEGDEAERFNKDNLQKLLFKMEPETIVKVKTSAEDKEGEILEESGGIHHNLEETAVKDDNQGPNPWKSLSRQEEGLQEDNDVSLNQTSVDKENVGIRSMEYNIIQEEHIGTQEHIEKPTKEHEALNSLCQTDETHEPEDIDVAATRECTEQAAVAGEAPVTELVEEGSKETRKAGEPIGTDYTNKHGTLGQNEFVEVNLSEITRSTETDITNKITNGVSIAATSINQTTEAEGEKQDEVPKFELQDLEANKVSTEEVKGASEVNKNTRFESIERKPHEEAAATVLNSTTSHIEDDQTNFYCLEPQKTEEVMSTEDIVDTGIKAKDMSPVGLQEVLVASDTEKGIVEDAPTTASILECTANETIEQSFEAVTPNGTEQDICGEDKNHCIEDNKSKHGFTNQEEDGSHIIEEKHTDDQAMEYLIQEQIAGNVTESSQEDNKTKGENFWMTINKAQDTKDGHATDLAPECIEGTIAKLSSYNEATESIKEELRKPELVNKEKSPDESQDYSHDDSIDSSLLQYDASIKGDYTNLDPQELQIDQNTAEEATSRPVAEEASLIKSSQDDEITEKSFQKGALEDRPAENLNTENEMDGAAVSTKDVQQIGQAQKEENIQTYRETTEEPKEEEKLVQNDDCNENKISKEDIANEASNGRECIDWESSPTTDKFELKRKGRVSELKIEEKPDSRTPIKSMDAKTTEQIPWVDTCGYVEGTATDDTLTRGISLHDGEAVDLSCADNKKEQQCNEKAVSELSELKNEKVVLNASVENYTKSFTKDPNPSSQLTRDEKINSPQKIEVETAEPQIQMLEEYGTTAIQNFEQTTNEEVTADDSLQIAAEIEGPDQGLDAVHSVEASQSEESESKKYQDKDILQGDHAAEETGDKVDDETANEAPDTRQKDEYKIEDGTSGTPSNNMPEETNNKLPMLPVKDKDTSTTDVSKMAEGTIHIRNAHEEITLQEDAKIQNLDHGGLQEVSVGNENNAVSEEVHKDRNLHNTLETHAQRNISGSRDVQIQNEETHEVRESNGTNKPDELKDNTGNREYEKENVDRTFMGIEASGPQSYAENENSYNIEEAVETKEVTIIEVEHHHHADEAPNTITDLRAEGSYESNNPLREPECSSKPAAEVDTPSETNKAENEERSRSMLDHCAKSAEEPTTEERQGEVRSLTTEATEANLEPDCPTDNAQETHQVPKETEFDNGAKMVPEESIDEENDVEKSHLGTGDKTDHKENPCKEQEASITAKTSEVCGTPEGEIQKAEDLPGPVCESPEEITKEQITEEPDHYNHTLDNTSKTEEIEESLQEVQQPQNSTENLDVNPSDNSQQTSDKLEIALTGQEVDSRNFEGTLHTISKLPITECDSPGQEGVTVEDLPSHAVAEMQRVPGEACEPTDEAHRKISEDSSTKKLDSDDMTAQKVSNGTVPHTTISLNKGDQQSQHLSSELFAESNAPTAIKDTEGENRMEVQILIPKNIEDYSSGRTIKETCMQVEVPREIGISNLGPEMIEHLHNKEAEEVHKTHETSIMKGESSLGLPCTTTMEGEKSTEPERTGDSCSKGTQDDEKTVGSDSDNSGKNNDIASQSHSTGKQISQDNTRKASEDTSNTSCQKADSTEHIPELHKIITESQETESKEENLEVTRKILSSIDNIPKDVCKELPMKPKDEHGSFTTEASKMKDATLLTSNVPEKIQQENEKDSENSDSLQQLRSTDNGKEIFLGEINENKYKDQHMTPQLNTRSISGSEDAEIMKGEETNEESKPTETNIEGTMKDEDTVKEGFQDNFENEKSSKEASIGVEKSGPDKVTNRQQDVKIPDDSIQESVEVKEVVAAENDASNSTNNWLSAEKNSESANPLEKLQYGIKAAVTCETLSETKADSEGESNNMEQHDAISAEQQVSEETCRKDTEERILTTHDQKTSWEDESPMNKEQDATQAYKEHELKEETESIQEEITANESSPKKVPQVIVQDRTAHEVTPVEDSDSQSKLSYEVTNSEKPEAMTSEVKGSSNIESEASATASTSEECVLPAEESQKSKDVICPLCEPPEESTEVEITEVAGNHDNKFNSAAAAMVTEVEKVQEAQLQEISQKGHDVSCNEKDQHVTDKMETASIREEKREPSEEISNSTSDQPAIDNEIVSESTTVENPPEYKVADIETPGVAVEAGDEVPRETNVNKTTEKLGSYDTVEETKLANEPESDNIYADATTKEEIATSQSPRLNKAEEESQQQFSGKNDASADMPELLNEDTAESEVTNMKREHLEEASTRTTAEDYPSQRPFLHHNVIESAEEEEGIEDTNQHSIDEGTISKSHQEADKYTREEANETSCTRMVAILSEEALQDSKIKDSTESIQEPITEQKNNFGELHQAIISTETDPENHDTSDSEKPVQTMNLEVIGNSNKDPEESTVARTMEECGTVEDERECGTVEDETKRPEDIIRKVHEDPEESMKGDNMEASPNCNNEVDNKSLTTATEKEILQVTQQQVNFSNMLNVSSNEKEQQKSDRIEIAPNVEEFDSTNHEEIPVTVSINASAECKSAGKEHRAAENEAADQPPEKERIHGAVVPKPEDEIPRETDQNPTTEQLSSDDTIEGKTICHSSYQDVESIMEDNIAVRQALPSNTTEEQPQHPSSESVPDAKETNAATIKKFTEEVNSNTAQIIKEDVRDDSFPKKIIAETSLPEEAPRDIEVFNLGSESSKNLHPREVLAEEVNSIDTVPILEHGESSLQMPCMNYPSGSEEISEANRIVGNFLQETKDEKEDQGSDNSGQKTDMSPQTQSVGEQTPQDNLERKCKEASDINHQTAEASEKNHELHDEGSTESEGTNMKEAHLKEVREKPTTEQCKCQETFESCILKERGSSAEEVEGEESLEDFKHQTIDEENKSQSHQEAEKGTGEPEKPTASTGMNENLHQEVPKDSDITEEVTDAKKINQPTNQDRTVPEVKSSVDSNSGSIQKHEAADLDRQTGCSEVSASIHNEPGAPTAARTLEISRTLEEESEMPDDVRSTMYEVLEESIKEENIEASEKDNAKTDNTSLRTATEEKSLQETRPQERMSDSFDASSNKKDELTMDEIEIAPKEEEVTSTNHEQTSNSVFNNPFPECKIAGKESAVFENQTPNEAPENLTAETCLKEVSGEVEDSNLNVKPSEDSQSKEALMEELQSTDKPSTLDTEGILAKLSCTNSFSEREKNIHSDLQDENRDSREVKGSNNSEHEIDCYPQSHPVGEEISDDTYKKTCISRHITVLSDELVAESEQTNFNKSHLEIGNSSERPQVTANETPCDEVERGDEFLSESNQQSQDEETKKDSRQEDNQIVEHAKNEGNQVFSTRIKDVINDQVPDINEKNGSMLEEIKEEESHVKKLHQATTGDRTKEKMEPVQDCNSVSDQNEDINIIVKKTEGSEVKKSSENKSEESSPTNMSESCLLKEEESQQPEDVTRAVSEVPEEGFNEDVIKAADICDNKLDGKSMTLLSGDKRMQTAEKQDNFMSTIDDSSSEQDQQTNKGSETAETGEIVGIKNLEQTTNSISTFPATEYKNGEQSVEAENSAEPEATEMLIDESKEEAPTGRTDENPTIEKLGSSEGVERPGETVSGTNYPGGAAIKKYETAATQTSLLKAQEYMSMDEQKMTTTGVPGDVDGQHARDEKAPTEHKDTLEVPPITNTGGLNDTDIHSTVCRSEEVKLEGERQKLAASSQIQDYLLTEKENLAGSSAPEDTEQVPKSSSAKTSDSLNPGNTYTDQAPEITSSTSTEDVTDSPPDLIVETRKVAELENVGMETEKMKCGSKEEGIDAVKDTKNISMTVVPTEISSSELHEKSVKVKEHPEAETLRLQEEIDQQGEKLEAQKVELAERSSEEASEVKGVADGCNQAPDEETETISSPKKELKAEECPEEKTKETFEPTKKQSENKQITDSHEMDTLATMDEQNVNTNPSDILAMRAIDETAHHEREDYANEEDTKSVASIGAPGTSKIPEEQKGNVLIDNSTANILQENQKFPLTESAQFASSTTDGSIVNEQRVSINNQENISSTETGQERTLGRDTNITAEEQVFSQKATERGIPEDSRNGSKDEKTQISMETPEMENLKSDDSEICSTVLPKIEERIKGSQKLLPSSDTKDPCTEICQKEGTMDTTNVTDAIQDIKPPQAIQVEDPARKEFSAVVQHDPSAKILQKDEGDNFRLEKEPTSEFEDHRKTGGVGAENVDMSESMSSTIILSSDPPKTSIAETSPMARNVIEEVEATVRRVKMQATEVKKVEISKFDEEKEEEEEEEGGEHESEDPGSAGLVNTEAPRDTNTKASHKKSHNILSGIKHSISKVKKVITGKSSHQKTASPK